METEIITTDNEQLPVHNPDFVTVICPMQCEIHGWILGSSYPTDPVYRKIDEFRDDNGYNIKVISLRYNHAVWLSTYEYSPQKNTEHANS